MGGDEKIKLQGKYLTWTEKLSSKFKLNAACQHYRVKTISCKTTNHAISKVL